MKLTPVTFATPEEEAAFLKEHAVWYPNPNLDDAIISAEQWASIVYAPTNILRMNHLIKAAGEQPEPLVTLDFTAATTEFFPDVSYIDSEGIHHRRKDEDIVGYEDCEMGCCSFPIYRDDLPDDECES